MSTLRRDPLTGRWVIIATGRGARPNEFPLQVRSRDGSATCPFCPGHEDQTTPEIFAQGRPAGASANGPGWRLRVFPNMYPALRPDPTAPETVGSGPLFVAQPGRGRHEVVVYDPDHGAGLATQTPEQLTGLFRVLRARTRAIEASAGVRFVSAFCNHGPEAGATLAHPHMQIIGVGQVPLLSVEKSVRSARHLARTGRCLLCEMAASEREASERIIADDGIWTVLAPWASRFPWEVLLVPRRHAAGLAQATDEDLSALGPLLVHALRGLRRLHGDLSLNLVVHDAPLPAGPEQDYADSELDALPAPLPEAFHWHIEILPRLSRQAGFEAGTGYAINSVEPALAASRLREEKESV